MSRCTTGSSGRGCLRFLNLARLQTGVSVPLQAGDIIGVGCPDQASSRDGSNFTFVYKVNPPQAVAETEATELQTSLSDLHQLSQSLPGIKVTVVTEVVFTFFSFQKVQQRH